MLGAATSGFVLVYAFGIERSLQMIAALNLTVGLLVAASLARRRWLALGGPPAGAAGLLVALGADTSWGRSWDLDYFAIFRNNQRDVFTTEEKRREALENTDVLYYHEGVNETISVVRPKGAMQAFIVNGRPEATTSRWDMQCQRTLGTCPCSSTRPEACLRPRDRHGHDAGRDVDPPGGGADRARGDRGGRAGRGAHLRGVGTTRCSTIRASRSS